MVTKGTVKRWRPAYMPGVRRVGIAETVNSLQQQTAISRTNKVDVTRIFQSCIKGHF